MGTWARAPQVRFCSSPIWSPQMRVHRQNRGKTKCTFIKLKTQTPRVQENGSLGRRRRGSGGQDLGTWRDRGWVLGLQELETRVPVSGMQMGSLGVVIAKFLGGAAGCSLGVGGEAHSGERSQHCKAGVPTTSTRSSGSHTQAGTAVEVLRLALHTATSWGWRERERDSLGQRLEHPLPRASEPSSPPWNPDPQELLRQHQGGVLPPAP